MAQRLIDADALKLSHCKECALYPDKCMGDDCDWGAIIHINAMPTIDAVPVIRCKACKWWREDSDHTCKHFYTSPRVANDFCSYAEPKDTTEEVRKQLKDMEQRREMDRKK